MVKYIRQQSILALMTSAALTMAAITTGVIVLANEDGPYANAAQLPEGSFFVSKLPVQTTQVPTLTAQPSTLTSTGSPDDSTNAPGASEETSPPAQGGSSVPPAASSPPVAPPVTATPPVSDTPPAVEDPKVVPPTDDRQIPNKPPVADVPDLPAAANNAGKTVSDTAKQAQQAVGATAGSVGQAVSEVATSQAQTVASEHSAVTDAADDLTGGKLK